MIFNFIVWNFDPVFLKIGSFSIRWYSLMMALGFYLGYIIIKKMFISENVPLKTLESFGIYIVLGMFIGGRLGHCLFYEPEYYLKFPLDIIKPWRGVLGQGAVFTGFEGMASHGGIIGVLFGLIINSRNKKLPILWVLDRFAVVILLTGSFIRLGNLCNSEIIGIQTSVPWAFIFVKVSNIPKHPVQLYEAIVYLATFLLAYYYYIKNKDKIKNGELMGLVFLLVFISRFFFEFIKENQTPSDAISFLKMGQVLSIPFILVGAFLFLKNKIFLVSKKNENT
ncbi:MAG: prolipoprotein diacylglyceryl transferase [Salinivirgaceae bacterium]|nr:prolipoprotein diacylglyceryl transferase [Salinivirgaceae bacterium]